MTRNLPIYSARLTAALRQPLSILATPSPRPTSPQQQTSYTPRGSAILEFDTFAEMQEAANALYGNCVAGNHYYEEDRGIWVLTVNWVKTS
jgi:hypothetical protein